jgi:AbrB family looped-hinge helix DNA binding protein
MMTFEVRIDDEGRLILPDTVRQSLGLQTGDVLRLVQTEDRVILIPTRLLVPEVADYLHKLLHDAGLTLDDLLENSHIEREKLFQERYGHLLTD